MSLDVLVALIDQDENINIWSSQQALWLSSPVEVDTTNMSQVGVALFSPFLAGYIFVSVEFA